MVKTESTGGNVISNNTTPISKEDSLKDLLLDKLLKSVSDGVDPQSFLIYSEIYKNLK